MNAIKDRFALTETEISREVIIGHFGNEIISIRAHVVGPEAQIVANRILTTLSTAARATIRLEMEKSMDEHDSLFLRIDRQSLDEPSISLSDEEPIRIKFKPKSRSGGRESIKKQFEELLK